MSGKKRGHHDVDIDVNDNDFENRVNGSHEEEEEDDDYNDDGRGGKKKSKKSSKKKNRPSKIMSESGQTDADRRMLRRKQRELHNDIAVGGASGGGGDDDEDNEDDDDADELTRLRNQNNDLWRDVRYTREAVLDSENVDLLASKAARQAEKVVQVREVSYYSMNMSGFRSGSSRFWDGVVWNLDNSLVYPFF